MTGTDFSARFYEAVAGSSIKTVSYTHLDVYKRQGLEDSEGKDSNIKYPLWQLR